tara:strand:- start:257 stop:955 length:699 start_codon:yes stop_codon:yes gene_type:complete
MKLIVKFPTRSRPDKFKPLLEKYISFLSGNHDVRFVITCDEDDETMNTEEIREWFADIQKKVDLVYYYGDSKNKVQAVNANLENQSGDVLLVVSDDMVPMMHGYDDIIAKVFQETFPNYDGAIKFSDGIRHDALMTLPCLGWKLYESFGYVYHPDYESLYCDNEQTHVCSLLNKLVLCDVCIIQHQWIPGFHKDADELHKRNESYYEKDGAVFKERESRKFDYKLVEEKLSG